MPNATNSPVTTHASLKNVDLRRDACAGVCDVSPDGTKNRQVVERVMRVAVIRAQF
jgi:hypothetical protein